jgi:hypothetical protein
MIFYCDKENISIFAVLINLKIIEMKKVILLLTLLLTYSYVGAQSEDDKTISSQYAKEIKVVQSEIKTLKLKIKADATDTALQTELVQKEAKLKELQSKKKVIDDAIKSKAASEKAAKKAEKAKEQAEKALKKAEQAEKDAAKVKEK